MRWLILLIYRVGFRPKAGNIFHRPSIAWHYFWEDEEKRREKDRRRNGWGPKF